MYTGREVWSPLEAVPCRAETRRATGKKGQSAKIPSQEKKKARETGVVPELGLVGGPRARQLTRRRAPSLVASCFSAFIANCDAIVLFFYSSSVQANPGVREI